MLGAPIGSREFTTEFVKKKLKALDEVCKALREVNDAQIEFGEVVVFDQIGNGWRFHKSPVRI